VNVAQTLMVCAGIAATVGVIARPSVRVVQVTPQTPGLLITQGSTHGLVGPVPFEVIGIALATLSLASRFRSPGQSNTAQVRPQGQVLDTTGPPGQYPPPSDAVMQLLYQGKKIHAIKLYREQTGASLKDAKDAVEAVEGPR